MYVDGFVLAVPTANREAYRKLADDAAVVFKDHGAQQVVECWGEEVPDGEVTSFPMAVKLQPDEAVVFAWIIWADKASRDAGNKKVFEDPRMDLVREALPFDSKRMIFGGFDVIVDR